MIDHMTLTVRDVKKSRAFYEKALAPLGYAVKMDFGELLGLGDERKPYFWLKAGTTPTQPMHIAFAAQSRRAVDQFHTAALAAGAKEDGAPGVRKQYHPNYYGAFVIDPDGHPIEAVCHGPAEAPAKKSAKPLPARNKARANAVKKAPARASKKKR